MVEVALTTEVAFAMVRKPVPVPWAACCVHGAVPLPNGALPLGTSEAAEGALTIAALEGDTGAAAGCEATTGVALEGDAAAATALEDATVGGVAMEV
jgi:hypothetical protein